MEAAIITTYRCVNKCVMCNIWKYPTEVQEEFKPEILKKLPKLRFANITGGEPMIREDIEEIVDILVRKAKRVVISTNGYFTEKIIELFKKFKGENLGLRVSLEGLPTVNDELRGMKDSFDHGLRTILGLQRMGIKDIGFGITVSDRNARDMVELYQLAKAMNVEFATAVVHNSYYFHKFDNEITRKEEVIDYFVELIRELFKTRKIKNWYRAYFNYGLIRRIKGLPRLLPCEAGIENFFLTPFGEVVPCNGSDEPWVMGNLNHQSWKGIWNGKKAEEIRERVRNCSRNCWMIGTASPVMKKYILKPTLWIIKHKFLKKKLCI